MNLQNQKNAYVFIKKSIVFNNDHFFDIKGEVSKRR